MCGTGPMYRFNFEDRSSQPSWDKMVDYEVFRTIIETWSTGGLSHAVLAVTTIPVLLYSILSRCTAVLRNVIYM